MNLLTDRYDIKSRISTNKIINGKELEEVTLPKAKTLVLLNCKAATRSIKINAGVGITTLVVINCSNITLVGKFMSAIYINKYVGSTKFLDSEIKLLYVNPNCNTIVNCKRAKMQHVIADNCKFIVSLPHIRHSWFELENCTLGTSIGCQNFCIISRCLSGLDEIYKSAQILNYYLCNRLYIKSKRHRKYIKTFGCLSYGYHKTNGIKAFINNSKMDLNRRKIVEEDYDRNRKISFYSCVFKVL